MPVPFIPLIALGATAFVAQRAYEACKTYNEAVEANTFAKITMETSEQEMIQARSAAHSALVKLAQLRQEAWAGPMAGFVEIFTKLEHLEPESSPLAGMTEITGITEQQLQLIRLRSAQALFAKQKAREDDAEDDADDDADDDTLVARGLPESVMANIGKLPDYTHPVMPGRMGFDSLIDLSMTLLNPDKAKELLNEARTNLEWAEKHDDQFIGSGGADKVWAINTAAREHGDLIKRLTLRLQKVLNNLQEAIRLEGVDCRQYSPECRRTAMLTLCFGQVMLPLLETPIITGSGELCQGQKEAATAGRALLEEIGGNGHA